MLAPLKDRSILELDPGDAQLDTPATWPETENDALVLALRQSRRALRLSATTSATKIIDQANEINRLKQLNNELSQRLQALESGQAITQLGQKLMTLSSRNEILSAASERICRLDKALCVARSECDYLVQECEIAFFEVDH